MKYDVIKAKELTPDHWRRWAQIQEMTPELASPYFRPEFTESVASVRDDVYVGLLEDAGKLAGFFPFHRRRGGIGRPVGLRLSDYHGVIVEPEAEWSTDDLLRGVGLVRYEFNHLLASQDPFARFYQSIDISPIIELANGYESFESSRDKNGRKQLRETARKRQRLENETGPLTYIEHTSSKEVLETLLDWKAAQCRRTGAIDYIAIRWCRELMEVIHNQQRRQFKGRLSCLYAGETLAAAHFTLLTSRVQHSWLPAYNSTYSEASPGMILMLEMIRSAADAGVSYIDLGKHMTLYKKRLMTGSIPVATGVAQMPSLINGAYRLRHRMERWGRSSILKPLLRILGRVIKNVERRSLLD